MDCVECVICLNDISVNDHFTLICCKNDVHIYCLNDWVNKNITKKNISKCFICSQENSMIETMVSYNKISNTNTGIIVDYDYNNSIINHNNNEIILVNDTNMLDIAYNIDKRLHCLFISIKLFFLVSLSSLLMLIIYYII